MAAIAMIRMTIMDDNPIVGLFVLLLWLGTIILGIVSAKNKNRSAHWMWFGLHPFGAIIMCIVMLTLPSLKTCPECGKKSKLFVRICPYCSTKFQKNEPGTLDL